MVASPFTMAGELTRAAIQAQPEWIRGVPERVGDRRYPEGRVVLTGCGTSFHAAQTGGEAYQALEAVLAPPRGDRLVAVSHEGETKLPLEAAQAFDCHTASYTCAVAALAALRGEDVRWLRQAVDGVLSDPFPGGDWDRVAVVGAGRDWPTAQEAVLKLREGVHIAAEAHETEQILHGHFAAIDEKVRVFVLEGEGRAAERAAGPRGRPRAWD